MARIDEIRIYLLLSIIYDLYFYSSLETVANEIILVRSLDYMVWISYILSALVTTFICRDLTSLINNIFSLSSTLKNGKKKNNMILAILEEFNIEKINIGKYWFILEKVRSLLMISTIITMQHCPQNQTIICICL